MAFFGAGNHGDHGWERNLRVHGRDCVVGRRRPGSGTILHARSQRGACTAANPGGGNGGAEGAGDLQRQVVRLAATGNALSDDANAAAARAARASGFSASGAKLVAIADWVGSFAGTRAPRAGVESRGGC